MNLVLIGYRGTGKSEAARWLAERLRWPWFDADREIEWQAGRSIARIFAEDGEKAFRDLESRVVAALATRDRAVLALGGGAVLRSENRRAIQRLGVAVWLTASPETLWRRIQRDASTARRRPNLSAAGGITEIRDTLRERNAIYRCCADFQVDSEHKTPREVADAILKQVRSRIPQP